MYYLYRALKRSRSLSQQTLRKRTFFNHYWFAVVILLFFSGVSRCVSERCTAIIPTLMHQEECRRGLYMILRDATTGENLTEQGILHVDSILIYGEEGLQLGVRKDTILQAIKIDFLGSDFCNKAKKVFYYEDKSSLRYEFRLSYLGRFVEDTLTLEAERTIEEIECSRKYIINIRALYRKRQGVWEEVPVVVKEYPLIQEYPYKRRYFVLTK